MKYSDILKQSWQILWNYRLLWIFGFIVALTTFPYQGISDWNDQWQAGEGTIIRTDENTVRFPGFDATVDLAPGGVITVLPRDGSEPTVIHTEGGLSIELPDGTERDLREVLAYVTDALPAEITQVVVGSLVVIAVVILGVVLVAALLRYPAEAGLITAVNEQAKSKKKAGFRELLRMGWSRTAWRFFLIDVAVRLPLLAFFALMFILALGPFALSLSSDPKGWIIGFVASAFLVAGTLFLVVITGWLVSLFTLFFRRACALEGLGVTAAIVRGFQVVFGNIKDVVVMTLLMLGTYIGWAVAAIPVLVLMIPIFLVLIVLGGLVAMTVLFPTAGVAQLFLNDVVAWVLGGSVALVIFIPIVAAPFTFLSGLLMVYQSSAWTLTYRELMALDSAPAKAGTAADPLLVKA
jgi:hypothetical protein